MLVRYDGVATSDKSAANMTFLIFKDQTGGEPLWIETQNVATDAVGKYEVYLGSTYSSGLPPDLFGTGEARWLEVQISGETPGPRTLLTSVPYAMKAADAATLGGLPASAFVLASSFPGASAASSNAITPNVSASNVTTTGGTNFYLPKFNAATTVVNSEIYDTGTSVGVGGIPNSSVKLDVNGAMIMRGNMQVTRTGNATVSKGAPSWGFQFYSNAYNSSTKANDNPYFQLQSEPSGNNTASPSATFNLLFSNNGSTPSETGFSINPNGIINFASGQIFPGTGVGSITGVTAGTDLIGGGTTGTVELSVDTTKIPTLSGNNSYAGSNTFAASLYEDIDVNIDNLNRNPGNISPGLRFGLASGEGMSSKRTAGGNQYGLDLYTNYQPRLSISAAGQVAIGTGSTFNGSQLQVQSNSGIAVQGASNSGTGVQGVSSSSYGVEGTSTSAPGVLGYTAGGTNNTGGVVGVAGPTSGYSGIAGVWGDANAHVGVFGSSGAYAGVQGTSNSGNGVHGVSTSTSGIFGETSSTSAADAALFGYSHNSATGVYGFSSKIGIHGVTGGASGIGAQSGTFANGSPAIWGDGGAYAVVGTTDGGVAGEFFNSSEDQSALYVVNNTVNTDGYSSIALFASKTGSCVVFINGDLQCTGNVAGIARVADGTRSVQTYSVQSAENWYEDAGSAKLVDGVAHVTLEPTFGQTVNTSVEYHVFLTPNGDSDGLYVSNKTAQGFDVHEQHGGHANIAFDYRIMAKPAGHENERLTDVTEQMQRQAERQAGMQRSAGLSSAATQSPADKNPAAN
jgi:hypothetical protein